MEMTSFFKVVLMKVTMLASPSLKLAEAVSVLPIPLRGTPEG